MARLGDLVTISSSSEKLKCDTFWLLNLDMVEQQTGNIIEYNYVSKDQLNGSIIQFDADVVLYSKLRPNLNKVVLPEQAGFATSEMLPLRPDSSKLLREYLAVYLRSDSFVTWAVSKTAGAKMPRLGTKELLGKEFSHPSLCEQRKIVYEFQKINKLISLRKQQLAKLDELVKSRFIEMFGNLVVGDKIRTDKHKIGEIASVTKLAGFEFTKYIQYKEQGDIIMLRGLNCKKGHLVLDDIKWIDKETSDLLPRSKLYYGDILMTYAGTIGDVAMVDVDNKYHLAPNVAKITLTDKMAYNPIFLMHLFMYTNDYIMTFASVVAQASINMEKIRNFEYHFPSVEQQNAFAAFVEQTDKSKFEIQKSLEKLETLKKALMQKYFG